MSSPAKRQALSENSAEAKRARAVPKESNVPLPRAGGQKRGALLVGALAPRSSDAPPRSAPAAKPPPPPLAPSASGAASHVPTPATSSGTAAAATASEGGARGPPLPNEYRRLLGSFLALETTISFFRSRGEPCFFTPLKTAVQQNTQREFSARTLRLLLGVWPEAFAVEGATVAASQAHSLLRTLCPSARTASPP